MLSHNNSRASSGLRRAKSSSSGYLYYTRTEQSAHLNAAIAHLHALTAAEIAFDSARGLETERDRSSESCVKQPGLGRRESVRYTGPDASPLLKRSITRRSAKNWDAVQFGKAHKTPESKVVGGSPHLQKDNHACRSRRKLTTPASASSSISIKTTGSLFPLLADSSRILQSKARGSSPLVGYRQHLSSEIEDNIGSSFAPCTPPPSVCKQLYSSGSPTYDDLVARATRDYLDSLASEQFQSKDRILEFERSSRSKPFPRTVRTTSLNRYGDAISSIPYAPPSQKRAFTMKRFRRKVINLFKKDGSRRDDIPEQQVSAQKAHYGGRSEVSSQSRPVWTPPPPPAEDVLFRLESRHDTPLSTPVRAQNADYGTPSSVMRDSRSVESLAGKSEQRREPSGTSTWEVSTTDTGGSRMPSGQSNSKRLTTIQEGQAYQPSGQMRRLASVLKKRSTKHTLGASDRCMDAMGDPLDTSLSKVSLTSQDPTTEPLDPSLGMQSRQGSVANPRSMYPSRSYKQLPMSSIRQIHSETSTPTSTIRRNFRKPQNFGSKAKQSFDSVSKDRDFDTAMLQHIIRSKGGNDSSSIYSRDSEGNSMPYGGSENFNAHIERPPSLSPLLPESPTVQPGYPTANDSSDQSSPEMRSIEAVRLDSTRLEREHSNSSSLTRPKRPGHVREPARFLGTKDGGAECFTTTSDSRRQLRNQSSESPSVYLNSRNFSSNSQNQTSFPSQMHSEVPKLLRPAIPSFSSSYEQSFENQRPLTSTGGVNSAGAPRQISTGYTKNSLHGRFQEPNFHSGSGNSPVAKFDGIQAMPSRNRGHRAAPSERRRGMVFEDPYQSSYATGDHGPLARHNAHTGQKGRSSEHQRYPVGRYANDGSEDDNSPRFI